MLAGDDELGDPEPAKDVVESHPGEELICDHEQFYVKGPHMRHGRCHLIKETTDLYRSRRSQLLCPRWQFNRHFSAQKIGPYNGPNVGLKNVPAYIAWESFCIPLNTSAERGPKSSPSKMENLHMAFGATFQTEKSY